MTSVICFCLVTLSLQAVTCQFNGNFPNAGFKNLQFGANFANGLAGPNLGSAGLVNPGYTGPGLGGNGLISSGLGGSGFIGPGIGSPLGGNGLISPGFTGVGLGGSGLGVSGLGGSSRASGGTFAVTSTSPITPTGVSILAENLSIEGPLSVGGQLPFLGTVGLDGTLPATGTGTVSYGCGNGNVGMTSDVLSGSAAASQYGVGLAGPGFGNGLASFGPNFGANLAGYNPGLGTLGGSLGPSMFGNGLAGVPGTNLANS